MPSAVSRSRWKLLPRRVDTRPGTCWEPVLRQASSVVTSACAVTTSLILSQAEMHCPQDLKFGHQSVALPVQKTPLWSSCRKHLRSVPGALFPEICICRPAGHRKHIPGLWKTKPLGRALAEMIMTAYGLMPVVNWAHSPAVLRGVSGALLKPALNLSISARAPLAAVAPTLSVVATYALLNFLCSSGPFHKFHTGSCSQCL